MIEDFLVLMAKMQEKKNQQPTQNMKMMRSEQHEDDPRINIVTQSGVDTREDKVEVKDPEVDAWVRKAGEKSTGFNLQKEDETFLEAKNSFMDMGAST